MKVYTLAELGQGKILPPPPLWDNFLLDNCLTLVSAEPGTGKTFFMLDCMISLDFGLPLLGMFQPKRDARCLVVARDSSPWDVGKQVRKLLLGRGIDREKVELARAHMWLGHGPKLTDPQWVKRLKGYIEEHEIDTVFFDSLLRMHNVNENDNVLMGQVMEVLEDLRDSHKLSIFISHHLSKPTEVRRSGNYQVRGATAITQSIDFHLQLRKDKSLPGFQMALEKGRDDLIEWDTLGVKMLKGTKDGRRFVTLLATTADPDLAAMLPASRADLVELLGKDPKWIDNTLSRLKIKGEVARDKGGVWRRL